MSNSMFSNSVLLRTEHLTKLYPDGNVSALSDVSIEIHRGEYVSIMGPSGSGKSTLLNLLARWIRPPPAKSTSRASPSRPSTASTACAQRVGFIFQSFYLLPVLSAVENVQVPMFEGSRLPAAARVKKATDLLAYVNLSHRIHHKPDQLSVGERQRVAIARVLANDPVLLLADEPTGNLDSKSAIVIFELIEQLHRERGMTIVMITHDDKLGERADRTIRLQDGKLKSDLARAAKAPAAPPSGGNGSVPAPAPTASAAATIPTVGSGPRPSARPKSVLPPFAVQ